MIFGDEIFMANFEGVTFLSQQRDEILNKPLAFLLYTNWVFWFNIELLGGGKN